MPSGALKNLNPAQSLPLTIFLTQATQAWLGRLGVDKWTFTFKMQSGHHQGNQEVFNLSDWAVITLISTLCGFRELYGNCTSSASLAGMARKRKMSQPSMRPSHSSPLLKPSLPKINQLLYVSTHQFPARGTVFSTQSWNLKSPPTRISTLFY